MPDAVTVRALAPTDLDAVVAIDAAIVGRSRRDYFERRLRAAIADPKLHVQFAADIDGALGGYVLARRLVGEFGRTEPSLRLEVIGARRDLRGRGVGRALVAALRAWAKAHGVALVRTQSSWRAHELLRFFAAEGFELARHQVIDCDVSSAARSFEHDQDGDSLARDRVEVQLLTTADESAVARIDRHLTGYDRTEYLDTALREALEASAVRVSLSARVEGVIAGYAMARTDLGDYGRTEPVAVLDTIGVDPAFARRGVGAALLSQLLVNLAALRVERVETVVARENFDLLSFLYRAGFGPSQRLAFERPA